MKKNDLRFILCLVSFLYSSFLCADNNGQSAKQCGGRVFLELTPSNKVQATVSIQTNIPKNRAGGICMSTNIILRLFYNEKAFGERWVLEGWSSDTSKKKILYDSRELFEAKENRRKKLKEEAEQTPRDKRIQMSKSINPDERRHANELFQALYDVNGGSRRSVERAKDISPGNTMPLVYEFPENLKEFQLKHGKSIRYIQLRIEPAGTNPMPILISNILDLQQPPATNSPSGVNP